MFQTKIKIENEDDLPFGILNNNYNFSIRIDNVEYSNVSNYIYSNLLCQVFNEKDILEIKDDLSKNILNFEYEKKKIEANYFTNLIIEGFNELIKDSSTAKETLINIFSSETKDLNILFVSDSFFGIVNEEVNNLKFMNRDVYSTNILGKAISKIRYDMQNNFVNIDLYREYCYYEYLKQKINSNFEEFNQMYNKYYDIFQNKERTREFMNRNISTLKMNFNEVKKKIKDDKELQKLLIVAIDYPIVLLLNVINKEYKNIIDKEKVNIKKNLLDEFLNMIIKENNLTEESKKELSYINNNNLGELLNIVYSLYTNKKIETNIKVKISNEENIINKESFSLDKFIGKNASSIDKDNYYNNNNFLFFEYSVYKEYDIYKRNYIFTESETDRLYTLYSNNKVIINKQEYSSIKNYIEYKVEELKNTYNEKLKTMLDLALNNKFGIGINKLSSSRNDIQCMLYLSNNFDISTNSKRYYSNIIKIEGFSIYVDKITSEYINSKSKEIDVKNIISYYNNEYTKLETLELINKDLFVKNVVKKKISTLLNVILNSFYYFKEKMEFIFKDEYYMSINSSFVISVIKNILNIEIDMIENKSNNISDFFVNTVKKELFKINEKNSFKEDELEKIINIIWNYVCKDIDILIEYVNMENEKSIGEKIIKLKEIIIKIQLSNSSYRKNVDKIIDNEEHNFLLSSIINIHNRLTNRDFFNKVFYEYIINKFQIKNNNIESLSELVKLVNSNQKIMFGKMNDYSETETKKRLKNVLEYYEKKIDLSLITNNDPIYKTICGILYNYNYLNSVTKFSSDENILVDDIHENDIHENDSESKNLTDLIEDDDDVDEQAYDVDEQAYDGKNKKNNEKNKIGDGDDTVFDQIDGGNKNRNIFLIEKYVQNKNNSLAFSEYLDKIKLLKCKTLDINYLFYLVNTKDINSINNILNTSDKVLNSRINFFRITPKKQKEYLDIQDFNEKNIYQCVKNVCGISSGNSRSQIWKISLNNNILFNNNQINSLVFKIFVDSSQLDNLNYSSEFEKDVLSLSTLGLEYEANVFNSLLKNIQYYKICPHFQTFISSYGKHGKNKYLKYNDLKNILFDNVFTNDCEIVENNIDYCLHRNFLMIINKTKINIPPINDVTDIKQFLKEEEFNNIFSNYSKIRNLKFNMLVTEFIGINERTYTLYNFLDEEKSNEYFDEMFNVLFQIIYALYVMSLCKMCHNDCHANNILLTKYDEIQSLKYVINGKSYIVKTRYKVKIIDFDRSYLSSLGDNDSLNNQLCENYAQCNRYVKNKDMIKIFCSFYNMLHRNMDILDLLSSDSNMLKQLSEVYEYNSDNENFCMLQYLPNKAVDDNFFERYNDCEYVLNRLYNEIISSSSKQVDNDNGDNNIYDIYVCDKLMFNENGTLNIDKIKELLQEEDNHNKIDKSIYEDININKIPETIEEIVINENTEEKQKRSNEIIKDNIKESINTHQIIENNLFPEFNATKVKEDVNNKIKDSEKIINTIMKLKLGGYVYLLKKKSYNQITVIPIIDIEDKELKFGDMKTINISEIDDSQIFNENNILDIYNKNIDNLKNRILEVNELKNSNSTSCSEKWIVKFTDNKKYFFKIFVDSTIYNYTEFINKVSSALKFKSEYRKFFFIYSTLGLNYEQQIYSNVIKPMIENNICTNFVTSIDNYYRYSYEDLLYIIEGKVNKNNKTLSIEKLNHNLSRNLLNILQHDRSDTNNKDKKDKKDKDTNEIEIYDNSKILTDFKFNIIINEQIDQFTLFDFIKEGNKKGLIQTDLYTILFQVAYTCYCLSQSKTTHNDLHIENIFVEYSESPKTFIYVIDNVKYIIKSNYKVFIFDFDRSYSQNIGNNLLLEEKKYISFCDYFSQCNEHVDNKDILKVLCYVFKYISDEDIKKDIINLCTDDDLHKKNIISCFNNNCTYEKYNGNKILDKSFFTKSYSTFEIMNLIYEKLPLINKYNKKSVVLSSINKNMFDNNGKFIEKTIKQINQLGIHYISTKYNRRPVDINKQIYKKGDYVVYTGDNNELNKVIFTKFGSNDKIVGQIVGLDSSTNEWNKYYRYFLFYIVRIKGINVGIRPEYVNKITTINEYEDAPSSTIDIDDLKVKGVIKLEIGKIQLLFDDRNYKKDKINLEKIRFTEESLYSITPFKEASIISDRIYKHFHHKLNIYNVTVTDATSNIGGNTISFYNHGINKINSVEIDSLTCEILRNNLKVYGYPINNVYCVDYLNIYLKLEQDCVFFDPPWGGPGYKTIENLDLFLGEKNVVDIIIELFDKNRVKYVVLKAPTNFNETKLLHKLNIDIKYDMLRYNKKKNQSYKSYYVYYITGLKSIL